MSSPACKVPHLCPNPDRHGPVVGLAQSPDPPSPISWLAGLLASLSSISS